MSNAMIEGDNTPLNPPDNPNTVTGANVSEVQGFTKSQVVAIAQNKLRGDLSMDLIGKGLPAFLGGLAQNIGAAIIGGIQGVANGIGSFFDGLFSAGAEIKGAKDGQVALKAQTELLNGVRGYCAAYQSVNINSEWNVLSSNDRYLPYEGELGPTKGAHIERGKNIVIDEKGLWLIFVQAHVRNTGFSGGDLSAIYVSILRPNGQSVREVTFDTFTGAAYGSIGGAFPVVIPEPGCWIRVRAWSEKWRWWDGGANNAWMAVVKQDNRTINEGQNTVPDETH